MYVIGNDTQIFYKSSITHSFLLVIIFCLMEPMAPGQRTQISNQRKVFLFISENATTKF
jgi:hypothetical protein